MKAENLSKSPMFRILVAVLIPALLVACGGDDGPAAPAVRTDLTIDPPTLDFGTVCTGESRTKSVLLRAPESNTAPVEGTIAVACAGYSITSGAGDYSLEPGDSMVVSVTFRPEAASPGECAVTTGANTPVLACRGAQRGYFWVYVGALRNGGFSSAGSLPSTWDFSLGGGTSYGDPSWNGCYHGFLVDGNPVTESKMTFNGLDVPAGVRSILVTLRMDASNSCAQLLIELDGNRETVKTSLPTSCTTKSYRISWPFSAAGSRNIAIGSDQQGITCFSDILIESIWITFEGVCGTSAAPPYETGEIEELELVQVPQGE